MKKYNFHIDRKCLKTQWLGVLVCVFLMSLQQSFAGNAVMTNPPDSVYLFSYSLKEDGGHSGLHFAYSTDQENRGSIDPDFCFLFSDYGRWGKEKRLVTPFHFKAKDGMWHCLWSLNEYDGTFVHAKSKDLLYWHPQSYPIVMTGNNCLEPEVSYHDKRNEYKISGISNSPIHPNSSHFAVLKIHQRGAGLINEGWDGIAVKAGYKYNFSIFARNPDKKSKKLLVRLLGKNGENDGETTINANSSKWKKITSVIPCTLPAYSLTVIRIKPEQNIM